MDLAITLAGRGELGASVYRGLRDAIEDGRLPAGERLPSTRDFARDLGVARNTVAAAYDALVAEGYAEGRRGSGTYVLTRPGAGARAMTAPPGLSRHLAASALEAAPPFDLRLGTPDPALFPVVAWRRALADALDEGLRTASGYGPPGGDPGLRAAIARHVAVSRGVRADAEHVIVTSGAQAGFDAIARVLVQPGDIVAVEDPGYRRGQGAFAAAGGHLVGVPVDAEGLLVEAIPPAARVVLTTPAHQMPMGVTLSGRRRAALLAWSASSGGWIVEDDYDSEFRYAGRPLEPLQRLARGERVVYVGSFSKTLLPMLRLGFVVVPDDVRPPLLDAAWQAGLDVEALGQLALRRLIDDGAFARHLRRARRVYRARHDRLAAAVTRDLGRWARRSPSGAGLHLAAIAIDEDAGGRVRRAVELARADGVAVEALAGYAVGAREVPGIAMGFGRIGEPEIDEAVRRLARAFATAFAGDVGSDAAPDAALRPLAGRQRSQAGAPSSRPGRDAR